MTVLGIAGVDWARSEYFYTEQSEGYPPPTWSMAGLDEPDNGVYSRGGGADLGKIVALNGY